MNRHPGRASWAVAKRYADRTAAQSAGITIDQPGQQESVRITRLALVPGPDIEIATQITPDNQAEIELSAIGGSRYATFVDGAFTPGADFVLAWTDVTVYSSGGLSYPIADGSLIGTRDTQYYVVWNTEAHHDISPSPPDVLTIVSNAEAAASDLANHRIIGLYDTVDADTAGTWWPLVGGRRGPHVASNTLTSGSIVSTHLSDECVTWLPGVLPLNTLAPPVDTVNFNGQQASALVLENRTSDPVNPTTGQLWIRVDLP